MCHIEIEVHLYGSFFSGFFNFASRNVVPFDFNYFVFYLLIRWITIVQQQCLWPQIQTQHLFVVQRREKNDEQNDEQKDIIKMNLGYAQISICFLELLYSMRLG